MYISVEKTLPNFAVGSRHYIDTITIKGTTVVVSVISKTASDAICWSEPVTMPYEAIGVDPNITVAEALTATGGYLEGGTITTAPSELAATRLLLAARVERLRDQHISGGTETPFGRVDTDPVSIRNILGSYSVATASIVASQFFEIKWRMADNSLKTLSAINMIELGNAVLKHVDFCYNRSWQLKDLVNAEDATVESLNSLDLTEGWIDDAPKNGEPPETTAD
jgi:hypothetical protein